MVLEKKSKMSKSENSGLIVWNTVHVDLFHVSMDTITSVPCNSPYRQQVTLLTRVESW